MKIAISNIAWNVQEDEDILKLLKKYSILGVEIAPTKIWRNPTEESYQTINKYRKYWEKNGISVSSTQSILFGHPELSIFGNKDKRNATLICLEKMIRVSAWLGAEAIVFGSPKNRNRFNVNKAQALSIASDFFFKIAIISKKYNVFLCIEPNPIEYGTNFINNTGEAIELVKNVNHPNFKLHLDSGVMTVNGENVKEAITEGFPYLKHFHISEKILGPIGKGKTDHEKIANVLRTLQYKYWVSIEMRGMENNSNINAVDEALKFTSAIYSVNNYEE